MAAFDAITELPPPSRNWDGYEEHEVENLLDEKPALIWQSELAEKAGAQPSCLVVAISQAACLLLRHLQPAEDVGSLSLPASTSKVNGQRTLGGDAVPLRSARSGVLLALCERKIESRHAVAWARALLGAVHPQRVLVLDCLLLRDFRGARLDIDNDPVFTVATDAEKAEEGDLAPCPFLPSGCLVDGFAAAVMSHCQVRGMPARLLAGVQAGPRPVYTALKALGQSAEACLGDLVAGSAWSSALKEAKSKLGSDANQPLVSELFI